MAPTTTQSILYQPQSAQYGLPDPGETVPRLSWPIVGIFSAALALFAGSSWAAVDRLIPSTVTIALNATVIFVMFTVVHDASHHSISSRGWVNNAFGRAAMLFVSTLIAFSAFRFIHMEHHRHANDDAHDPDSFATHGTWWQLPVRFAAMDAPYLAFYARNYKRRPRSEVVETCALLALSTALIAATVVTGHFWLLAAIYLIPQRIALIVLAWWFDWLPHHDLEDTQSENRYRATRARVGMEWLLTPLMLSQNYHLVHHLHPSIPFYRYLNTWRRNEEAYLERDVAIATVFGQQLNPGEFRRWKDLNRKLLRLLPVRMPKASQSRHAAFHKVPVESVERLTADSVAITFHVPEQLREEFRFRAGQHLTLRTDLGGKGVRRCYSICSPATGDKLRIGIKRIPGGAFSTFALEQLRPGDVLELMPPTGRFGIALDPRAQKNYVAIAAGSGITPILSVLTTTLQIETRSHFTLIYANRIASSTMFKQELADLESRYSNRFKVLRVLSRDPSHPSALSGRIDHEKLHQWLASTLQPHTVDDWFVCGPIELVTMAHQILTGHGVDPDQIHSELFFGYQKSSSQKQQYPAATVTVRLSGTEQTIDVPPGKTVLEATLQVRDDVPYACIGGACGTCRARLLDGTVQMDQNFALAQADVKSGYILTCQSHPTSRTAVIDYDV